MVDNEGNGVDGEPMNEDAGDAVIVQKRTVWQRVRVRLFKTIAALVLGLVALAALIVFGIDTGPGHRFVADQIGALKFENGMRITVGRIDGSIYGKMTLHDLSVRDPQGEFLFAPEIHVDWRPFEYLSKHVNVRSATAQRVILRRTPHFKQTPTDPNAPLLPDLNIDVGRLKVDRFVMEPPVSGKLRVLTFDGRAHIADGRAQVFADGGTVAVKGKDGGDSFRMALDAVPDKDRLNIGLDLNAPKDGMIAALAGLKAPLRVRIDGKGDWKAWNGRMTGTLGAKPLADLAIAARSGTFHVKGQTEISRLTTGPAADLLGPRTDIDVTAAFEKRVASISGLVSSDAFTLAPRGTVDLGGNVFHDLHIAFSLGKPSAIAPNLSGAGIAANLTLDGAFATPRVAYDITARRLVMNGMGLEGLRAHGAAKVDSQQILIPVAASVQRITGLDTVAGGKLDNVRLNGDLAIKGGRVLSDNLHLVSPRIDAKVIVVADMQKGVYTGAINGRVDHYRLESVGIFNISTQMDLKSRGRHYALEGTVRARSTQLLNDSLKTYLGGNFAASSHVAYGDDGTVRFSALRLSAPDLAVRGGRGSWSPNGRIALVANGTSDRYGKIGVNVKGTITNPDAHVTAEHPGFGLGLANVDARVTGAKGGYRLAMTSDTDYGPLKADVTLATGKTLAVQINSANLSGVNFAGQLRQVAAGPFEGELTAQGNGVGGSVRLSAQGKVQAADFNLRAKNTVFRGPAQLTIGSAIIDGRAVLTSQPQVVADAQLSGTTLGTLQIVAARVLVDYRNGAGHAKAVLEGDSGVPFRIAANAQLAPKLWRVALDGRVRGLEVKTQAPARIVPGADGGYTLEPTTLSLGDKGTARIEGSYGAGMQFKARLENVDMSIANGFVADMGLGGTATGSIDFAQKGASEMPTAQARLSLTNFTRTTSATVSTPVDIDFKGSLSSSGGDARAVIRQRGSVLGRMVTTLKSVPAGGETWIKRLMQAQLGGGIRYNGPGDTLFSFAGATGQRFSGPVGLAADFSCKLSDPCVKGVVKARGVSYQNQTYGTTLSDLNMDGHFDGNSFVLDDLSAKAGSGSISASGTVGLAAAAGYPMDVTVKLDNAQLAKSENITASANGSLHLTKKAGETALLSGTITLPETRYTIVREGAAQVPSLSGVHFKPRRTPKRITGEEPAQPSPGAFAKVRLDLKLRAPEKLYVSGMGLESEWSAKLDLQGTSANPKLSGQINLVRGTLGFASRSFTLSDGRISFTGEYPVNPTVSITATDSIDDVDVTVSVTGRAFDPQIDFSSSPSLPDDEIVSRILFGSSVSNLSALQAVQLAASLNSLRGSGGGLNPLGKLRSATGIDRLRVLGPDANTGRGTALAAGQYITDDIYVELITDARGFTATQLEISLTKWLSVISQAGGSNTTSFSVKIKKDY